MELDLQGNIERFTLPEIFQLVAAGRKSGTLGIQREDSIVMVYFKDGNIIYGYGPRQTFHLGQLLQQKGIITAEQLREAVEAQGKGENSKRLGEILISRRFIDRADLEAVVKGQVEELLYSLLSWQVGSFKFYEDLYPTEEEITVSLSVENVILEGLRRLDEKEMVSETIPDLDVVFSLSAAQQGRGRAVTLEATEWNVMALVDGRRSVREICKISPVSEQETRTKMAQLLLAGIITKTDRKPQSSVDFERMANRLAGLFEEYLTEKKTHNRLKDHNITHTIVEATE